MTAAKPSPVRPPHPFLQSPSLFIDTLPAHVLDEHVTRVFQGFYPPPALSFSRTKNGRNRGVLRPRVDFFDVNSAEKALAVYHFQPIPAVVPSVLLKFSVTAGRKPFGVPNTSVSPRLIKILPAECTEQTLYDLLRPYGPIYSVRIHPIAGGLVQFWDETQTQDAATQLAPKMILNAYDPCSLYCSNLSLALDACAFRTHFAEYGNITDAVIFTHPQTGKSRGQGIITFSQASEASTALQAMHGVEIEWKLMSVTYHLLNMRGRPAHGKPASEKTHTSEAPLETPPLATWRDRAKNARMPQAESMTKKAGVVDAQTDRDSFEKPHTPGPQIKTETAERGMPTLQVLYDTEKACRIATQAENERLRAELVSMKQQGNAENKLLREELESVKQLDAENELLREELESVKQLDAENELLLEELESAKLQGEAEIELLKEKLESTRRALEMAESRLKILQLEADRPLWEAAKKKREENQRAERAKEEERRRAAEVEESRRKMREFQEQEKARKSAAEKERMRRQAEEKARREKEEQEREQRETAQRERERLWKAATEAEEARCEKRDEQMFGAGAWTPLRALERLKLQVAEFEKIKFSEGQPLTFRVIPWPVLTDPLDSDIEQIEWNAVEAFFTRAKIQLATNAEYNGLVEKVHRLFHPDKWKSRNLLVTVLDEELRKSLETAGNVVAQAMTPIWRKSRGYLDH